MKDEQNPQPKSKAIETYIRLGHLYARSRGNRPPTRELLSFPSTQTHDVDMDNLLAQGLGDLLNPTIKDPARSLLVREMSELMASQSSARANGCCTCLIHVVFSRL